MSKIVYEQWRKTYEVNIIGVYEDEDVAYRERERRERELIEDGVDTEDDVTVWIEDVDIIRK